MKAYSAATGQKISENNNINVGYPSYLAISGDNIYLRAFYAGKGFGIAKVDANSLAQKWFATANGDPDQPFAIDASEIISIEGIRINQSSGVSERHFERREINPSMSAGNAFVVMNDGEDSIFSKIDSVGGSQPHLASYSRGMNSRKWIINENLSSNPIVFNGVIYTIAHLPSRSANERPVLKAIDIKNGTTLWTLPLPGTGNYPMEERSQYDLLMVGNHIFLSPIRNIGLPTLAVDISKKKIVWRFPINGRLAVSDNGILYIHGSRNGLVAVNLH